MRPCSSWSPRGIRSVWHAGLPGFPAALTAGGVLWRKSRSKRISMLIFVLGWSTSLRSITGGVTGVPGSGPRPRAGTWAARPSLVWRAENLRVAPRRKGKRLKATIGPEVQVKAEYRGHVWALDFQFDSDWRGRAIKICNIIDEFTREHVSFAVGRALKAKDVIELLDLACLERGRPKVLRMDNGPEFISHTLEAWAAEQNTIRAFIPPGQPWRNGYVESFHNRMRDELLEENLFDGIDDAHQALES